VSYGVFEEKEQCHAPSDDVVSHGEEGKERSKEGREGRVWEGRTRRRTKDGRADEGEGKGRRGSTRGGSDNH
jgi:hypothetical protein